MADIWRRARVCACVRAQAELNFEEEEERRVQSDASKAGERASFCTAQLLVAWWVLTRVCVMVAAELASQGAVLPDWLAAWLACPVSCAQVGWL